MKQDLLENGIDSLKFGIEFYNKYLQLDDKYDSSNPGYLKLTINSIHHTIEILSKKLLTNENELLIYNDVGNETLLGILKHKRKSERDIPLDWYLISDQLNVLTIGFTELIKRVKIVFELSQENEKTLLDLGKARNKLAHYGLDKTFDYHELLITINDTLHIISSFYYPNITINSKINFFNNVIKDLFIVLKKGYTEETEAWETLYADEFENINYTFSDLLDNQDFISELELLGYKFDLNLGEYSNSAHLSFSLENKEEKNILNISSVNIPRSNITLFVGDTNTYKPLYFLIDHSRKYVEDRKDYFFLYKNIKHKIDLDINEKGFWLGDIKRKLSNNYEFNKENLIKAILTVITFENDK
ncbi:hypothetical protein ABER02_08165 [Rossellomorea marisflavi]|uniref:hypothetical protein n=1 Tax=Rossellomorea marisflavi TaxID=189381 RepID=UPI003D28CB89